MSRGGNTLYLASAQDYAEGLSLVAVSGDGTLTTHTLDLAAPLSPQAYSSLTESELEVDDNDIRLAWFAANGSAYLSTWPRPD